MPNLKIYVDEGLMPQCRAALQEALPRLRTLLCDRLAVGVPACQVAVLAVMVMPDLPRVNIEMQILPHPERTRDRLLDLAAEIQALIDAATGTQAAVRIATLDPATYIALKPSPPTGAPA